MEKTSFLAFSCPHCPHHDSEAIEWLLGQIAKRQPKVIVHLGDGHEADSASKWADSAETTHTLLQEYESHNRLLLKIRKSAAADTQLWFIEGNHDANLRAAGRIDPRLRDLVDYKRHEPELEHWDTRTRYAYDRKLGSMRLGQAVFSHGYETSVSGCRREALYFAREFGLYVHGHTHRPTQQGVPERLAASANTPLNWWRANPGCMRGLKPDFVRRKSTSAWGQAIVVGSAEQIKSPRSERRWDAETIWFRDYEAWADGRLSASPSPSAH